MKSTKISKSNHSLDIGGPSEAILVRSKFYNDLKDDFDAHITGDGLGAFDTISEYSTGSGVTIDGVKLVDNGIRMTANVTQKTVLTTITVTEIVGTTAGDIGHSDGAELVAAPGAGYALQFISAVLIYDYDTAAYTGGSGDDLTVYINSVAVSPAIATADLITKAGDTVISLSALSATDYILGVNSNINLAATEITQPGTAAGVLRVYTTYNIITTGL